MIALHIEITRLQEENGHLREDLAHANGEVERLTGEISELEGRLAETGRLGGDQPTNRSIKEPVSPALRRSKLQAAIAASSVSSKEMSK